MSTYLTWLADELRAAGCRVVEQEGWQSRARSSGGFADTRPWCVMWHHTASSPSTSAESDASYMSYGSDSRPIANLMIARNGDVWVLAAGATNTNGKGGPWITSRGTVPLDSMNTHGFGIEICNDGLGEPYSEQQIDAAFLASIAVAERLGLDPEDVCNHHSYAPDRKIDPARADAVQGLWQPRGETGSDIWVLADLKAEHRRRWGLTTPEPTGPWSQSFDISKWQAPTDMDVVANSGVEWIYFRAWNGKEGADPTCDGYVHDLGGRLPFGLYCRFYPNLDIQVQIAGLVDASRRLNPQLRPQLDLEWWWDTAQPKPDSPTNQEVHDATHFFVEGVEAALGYQGIVYTNGNYWNAPGGPACDHFASRMLWAARYYKGSPLPENPDDWVAWATATDPPYMPIGWSDYDVWQCSADGNHAGPRYGFGSDHVDCNIARPGVLDRLRIIPLDPGDDDMPDEATFKRWVRDVLNEGTAPGQTGWAGTSITALQVSQANFNETMVVQAMVAELHDDPEAALEAAQRTVEPATFDANDVAE